MPVTLLAIGLKTLLGSTSIFLGSGGRAKLNLDLPYTKAVIQEGFRIRPVAPLSVPRKTTRDVSLMGYHIPKNTQVGQNIKNHEKF